eukprot:CAMPEP_0116843428 /NCGR_PEP_ID=MMETSP0418-20121206/12084_1 /TAXON_ID=1158023 /ORGANISM="Astrosyne radiata, Strain 13vi08-1A" /LENGTH=295 /DNA_ID=CAMNT_0004474183 /DNA_START=276 /DNA_END=1163 /DNA_ORIENTATION=+
MTESGDVDVESLNRLLDFHLDQGTDNLCLLGTTGEASLLSMEERKLVLDTAVKKVKGKIPLMVGTGTINPSAVKAMTLQAMECGADASLVVTPYYLKPPQRGLVQHYTSMADLGLPVIIYNVPGRTRVDMTDESIAQAAQHPNIVGLKDATGDVSRVVSLKTLLGDEDKDLLLFSGDDQTTLDFLQAGGDGCISVTANLAPKLMHEMVTAAHASDFEESTRINGMLDPLHKNLFLESNPIPVKWALYRMGKIASPYCRPPLDALRDLSIQQQLVDDMKQTNLLEEEEEEKSADSS